MSDAPSKNGKPAWVKWPAICVLALVWLLAAPLSWVLGGMGKGALAVAEWAVDRIDWLSD